MGKVKLNKDSASECRIASSLEILGSSSGVVTSPEIDALTILC